MKRVEAVIKTEAFPEIRSTLESMNIYSLSKHDISAGSIIGDINRRGLFLSKLELIVGDKDASKIINIISKFADKNGKIFVSDLNEVIDPTTFESKKEIEESEETIERDKISRRSRLVPLQKYTMMRAEKFYDTYKDILRAEYRVRSYSDFINFCIASYIPTLEDEIRQNAALKNHKI